MSERREKVAFIGLGNMGEPMARTLLKAGYELSVVPHKRSAPAERLGKEGANIASSAREAARGAHFVVTMVPDLPEVEEAAFGEEGFAQDGSSDLILLNTSTVLPSGIVELARRLGQRGVGVVDAPVSGGPTRAQDGTLTIMASGERAAYDKTLPLLETMGRHVFYLGEVGKSQVAKLCNNALGAMIMLANSEVLTLGVKAGLDAETLREVVTESSGANFILDKWLPQNALKGSYEAGFALELMYKDIGLARELAREEGTTLLLGNLAHELYGMFDKEDTREKDYSVVSTFYQEAAGISLSGNNQRGEA